MLNDLIRQRAADADKPVNRVVDYFLLFHLIRNYKDTKINVFRYPAHPKILLFGAWRRRGNPTIFCSFVKIRRVTATATKKKLSSLHTLRRFCAIRKPLQHWQRKIPPAKEF
jgi:hypothetical protein